MKLLAKAYALVVSVMRIWMLLIKVSTPPPIALFDMRSYLIIDEVSLLAQECFRVVITNVRSSLEGRLHTNFHHLVILISFSHFPFVLWGSNTHQTGLTYVLNASLDDQPFLLCHLYTEADYPHNTSIIADHYILLYSMLDIAVVGAGPCALALVSRLACQDPDCSSNFIFGFDSITEVILPYAPLSLLHVFISSSLTHHYSLYQIPWAGYHHHQRQQQAAATRKEARPQFMMMVPLMESFESLIAVDHG